MAKWRRWLPIVTVLLAVTASPLRSSASPLRPSGGTAVESSEMQWGPFVVPAAVGERPGVLDTIVSALPMPCLNCYLTGVQVDLVFEDGRSANLDQGVMLHHFIVFNSARPDSTCGPDTLVGALGERFFMAYNDRTGTVFPPGFGYHLAADRVGAAIAVMNHTDRAQVVRVEAKINHVADPAPELKPVRPVWLDENNCRSSAYEVFAGPSHRVWEWKSTLTGRVLSARGHLHDGGIRIAFANSTTGRHLCTSYARYGTNPASTGTVDSMSTCVWDRLGTVRAGETLAIDTYYDPPQAQPDVMGVLLAFVYETDDLTGGTAPPPDGPAPPWPPLGGVPSGHGHQHHH
ncbi:MAG TPA: hypothetical protein VGO87_06890 [Acidimicrobiia bacterium]